MKEKGSWSEDLDKIVREGSESGVISHEDMLELRLRKHNHRIERIDAHRIIKENLGCKAAGNCEKVPEWGIDGVIYCREHGNEAMEKLNLLEQEGEKLTQPGVRKTDEPLHRYQENKHEQWKSNDLKIN